MKTSRLDPRKDKSLTRAAREYNGLDDTRFSEDRSVEYLYVSGALDYVIELRSKVQRDVQNLVIHTY